MATASENVLKPDHGSSTARHPLFTEEHDQLRESIRGFVSREFAPHAEEWEETTFPDECFAKLGAQGYLGLDKPEELGGQGGDYASAIVFAEEMAHSRSGGLAMGVAVQTDMAMPPIIAFGTDEQKQQWVVPAIRGEKILCLGITEPDAGSDVAGIKTRAVKDGDDWVINGSKTYITNGHRADVIVLVTKTDPDAGYGGFTLFLVPMDTPGVIREKRLQKLGMHASDTALLAFQDVRVPNSAVLGEVGKGFYHIMWELQGERLIGAAGCVAGAQRCFDQTLEYAKQRTAFGRQIGRFQAIRHKFAEMATKLETARQRFMQIDRERGSATVVLERVRGEMATVRQRIIDDLELEEPIELLDEPVEELDIDMLEAEREISRLKERLRRVGYIGDEAVQEFERESERHTFLTTQLDDVLTASASLRELLDDLRGTMQQRFEETFTRVADEFSAAFTTLFGGGSAKLVLIDDEDGGPSGVDIVAQPPGKRLQSLALLSGGERALTAAALLFAILKVNPSPFVLLDEVDAALDEANVVRFRERLQGLAADTQAIIITHNRGTIESAGTLYGVSMRDDGTSTVLSLRLSDVVLAD